MFVAKIDFGDKTNNLFLQLLLENSRAVDFSVGPVMAMANSSGVRCRGSVVCATYNATPANFPFSPVGGSRENPTAQ